MLTAAGAPAAAGADGPGISRQAGQELARHELSKLMYRSSTPLIERAVDAVLRFLSRAGGATPGGWWTLVALSGPAVTAAVCVLAYLGPVRRSGRQPGGPLLTSPQLTARDYRQSAQRLAAAGQFSTAMIDCMRAIAAELDERQVLARLPGRTAGELARDAGRALPALNAELAAAARLFEDVRYGGRAGSLAGYQRLRDLDAAIRAARPLPPAAPVLTAPGLS